MQKPMIWAMAVSLTIALATPGAAQQAAEGGADRPARTSRSSGSDQEAIDLLRQIEHKYGSSRGISGSFEQVSDDPAFGEKRTTTGDFYIMKPNQFRADYKSPNESTNLVVGRRSYQYVKDLNQVTIYDLADDQALQELNYMLLGFGVGTDKLLQHYDVKWLTEGVAAGYYGVQLVPRDKEKASFKWITMLITKDDRLLPRQISMEQFNSVRVTANLHLDSLRIGEAVSEKKFRPDFPRGTQEIQLQ